MKERLSTQLPTRGTASMPWIIDSIDYLCLDAAVMAYTSVSVLRQQMKPTWRVHSVIKDGGKKPNIIPEYSELQTYVRAPNLKELNILTEKITKCYTAAAEATGCKGSVSEEDDHVYIDIQQNPVLAELFGESYRQQGVEFGDVGDVYASTDMGNVSYEVPSLHPCYAIGSGEVNHSREFTAVANTPAAHASTLAAAKAMAHTAIDVLTAEGLLDKVRDNFKQN